MQQQAQAAAAAAAAAGGDESGGGALSAGSVLESAGEGIGKTNDDDDVDDDTEADATGLGEKDIELVMAQANVPRNKAIKALKKNDNDVRTMFFFFFGNRISCANFFPFIDCQYYHGGKN